VYDPGLQAFDAEVCAAIGDGLLLTGRRWRARLNERLKTIGQTDARCAALVEIAACADGVVQRELSQRLGVEEPTVVRLIDALEAQNCVERRAQVGDRRVKVVQVTPNAGPVVDQAREIVAGLREEMFSGVSATDLEACLRVLQKLSARLERV
jgi:MarR family transcriptional regulator for hemolysin